MGVSEIGKCGRTGYRRKPRRTRAVLVYGRGRNWQKKKKRLLLFCLVQGTTDHMRERENRRGLDGF